MYMKIKSKLIKNIMGSFFVKGLSILVSYLTIPAYMSFFENQNILGVWLSIISLLTWIINFDLGIGNGLRNKVSLYLNKRDYNNAKKYISSSYVILTIIALCIGITGYLLIYLFDWNQILNISIDVISVNNLKQTISFVFLGIVLYFILKIIGSILLSMEKVAIVNFLQLLTSLANLVFIVLYHDSNPETGIKNLAIFYIISLNVPYLLVSIILFIGKLKSCKPSITYFDNDIAFSICSLGGKFFIIQLILLVINSSNEFLISNIYGPNFVVEYQVYYKLFYLIVMLFSLITNPIWSNITVAYNNHNLKRIIAIRKILNKIAIIASIGIFGMIFLFDFIMKIWLKDNSIDYNLRYGLIFSIFCILMIFVLSETAIANGITRLKSQLYILGIGAMIKFPLSFALASFNFGWISVVFVNVVILIPFLFFQNIELNVALKERGKE